MLVITRRIGEMLRIGEDVRIVVLNVRGRYVRLGILAPKEISVHREEIYEQIKREKAASTACDDIPKTQASLAPDARKRRMAGGE